MSSSNDTNNQSIIIRCSIPLELHRKLRSILALRGEKVNEWMTRMAKEEVQATREETP